MQSGRSRGVGLGKEEEEQLRSFIVNMVSEPLVLVIKLADRLHNMRTVFALKKDKQRAVATETLQVWCSLAERLGMMVLKVHQASGASQCFMHLHPSSLLRALSSKPARLIVLLHTAVSTSGLVLHSHKMLCRVAGRTGGPVLCGAAPIRVYSLAQRARQHMGAAASHGPGTPPGRDPVGSSQGRYQDSS